MAGGGIKGGITHGATDELGYSAVEDVVHVHDLHATILALFGIDHHRLTLPLPGPRLPPHRRRRPGRQADPYIARPIDPNSGRMSPRKPLWSLHKPVRIRRRITSRFRGVAQARVSRPRRRPVRSPDFARTSLRGRDGIRSRFLRPNRPGPARIGGRRPGFGASRRLLINSGKVPGGRRPHRPRHPSSRPGDSVPRGTDGRARLRIDDPGSLAATAAGFRG